MINSCKCFKSFFVFFFFFVLRHKMDNEMLRLLIVFFLGMLWRLVGVLQSTKYEITSITCCRIACSAWWKLLKPSYIYGTYWHYVTKKSSSHIKNITSQKLHLATYTANLIYYCYCFSDVPEAGSFADFLHNKFSEKCFN